MAFTEKFNVANAAIETLNLGAGWTALDSSDSATSAVTIVEKRAGCPNAARSAVAWYALTVPVGVAQECGAWITGATGLTEGSGAYVDVGVLGKSAVAAGGAFAALDLGVWARLHFLADGVRRLEIRRKVPGDAAEAAVRTVDLVLAGTIAGTPGSNVMAQQGALGAPNLLRIIVVADDAGLVARAYVNQTDDDRPTLEARIDRDFVGTGDDDQLYGHWWIGFGASGLAHGVVVDQVYGSDYDVSTDKAKQELRDDQISLEEARRQLRAEYERVLDSNLGDSLIDAAIRYTIEDIIVYLGAAATFLHRTATTSLTMDANGLTTMPTIMRRVISVRDGTDDHTIYFERRAGSQYYVNGLTGSYSVTYVMRHAQISDPADPIPIPREYVETVMLGAAARLSRTDTKSNALQTYTSFYEQRKAIIRADLERDMNAQRPVFRPLGFTMGYD